MDRKPRGNRSFHFEHWQLISLCLAIYDAIAVNAAFYAALWLRYDCKFWAIPAYYIDALRAFAPVYTVFCLLVFWCCKLYKSIWRFAGAHEMYRAGKPMEEVAQWLEDNKLRAQAWFTVDDLKYLQRGGRISATAAALGTLLDLKPILTETLEGKLAAAGKVRGRRKAMSYILEKAVENVADQKEAMGIILHADAMDDAQKLRQMLVEKLPEMDIRIYPVGPVIGTHAGPGTIAFCFLGKKREI